MAVKSRQVQSCPDMTDIMDKSRTRMQRDAFNNPETDMAKNQIFKIGSLKNKFDADRKLLLIYFHKSRLPEVLSNNLPKTCDNLMLQTAISNRNVSVIIVV